MSDLQQAINAASIAATEAALRAAQAAAAETAARIEQFDYDPWASSSSGVDPRSDCTTAPGTYATTYADEAPIRSDWGSFFATMRQAAAPVPPTTTPDPVGPRAPQTPRMHSVWSQDEDEHEQTSSQIP